MSSPHPSTVLDVRPSMTNAPQSLTTELVGEIVSAFRLELAYWIPAILSPLVEELKDLRNQGTVEKDQPRTADLLSSEQIARSSTRSQRVSFQGAPAAATDAIIVAPSYTGAPPLEGCHEVNGDNAAAGDQQTRTEPIATTGDFSPMETDMEIELEMSTPLVDPAGPPESSSGSPYKVQRRWSWRPLKDQQSRCLAQKGGYHLTPRCDSDEPGTEFHYDIMKVETDDDDGPDVMDPEAAERLPLEIADLETKVKEANASLEDLGALWKTRCKPYEEDIAKACRDIQKLQEELEFARMPRNQDPLPPGPVALRFIDSEAFAVVANLAILLNLTAMILGPEFNSYAGTFKALDHIFLAWYVMELSLKAMYYQRFLLFGKISVVWWNYLDLGIVVSGVIDQWLLPLLSAMNGGHLDIDTSALRMLRVLRLFRIMRFLRIIKAFLQSDIAWTEGAAFEFLMAGVIAFNSVVMSIELDVPWVGWLYVENFLQIVYTFELTLRLKRQCCIFFVDMDNMVWNYLDFIMVAGGALDLWLVPLIYSLRAAFFGSSGSQQPSSLSGVLRILKIMRILRVLRLVRLLKMVKPLYRLLMGVISSVKAMQWVMVLTFLTLYACSIVFTDLVGKGLISGSGVTENAFENFGSVPKSLFSLFKLMNGDMSVVAPITGSVTGQLLFAGFMVVSNWAILAVLTAVVSDNMITTSQKANEEDEQKKNEMEHQKRIRRLTALFREIDHDGEGSISVTEWQRMLEDRSLHRELCDATGLDKEDLNDYFECLAKDPKQEERDKLTASEMANLNLDYQTFIEALKDEGVLADKRSILHVMKQLRIFESTVKRDFEELSQHHVYCAA